MNIYLTMNIVLLQLLKSFRKGKGIINSPVYFAFGDIVSRGDLALQKIITLPRYP